MHLTIGVFGVVHKEISSGKIIHFVWKSQVK